MIKQLALPTLNSVIDYERASLKCARCAAPRSFLKEELDGYFYCLKCFTSSYLGEKVSKYELFDPKTYKKYSYNNKIQENIP